MASKSVSPPKTLKSVNHFITTFLDNKSNSYFLGKFETGDFYAIFIVSPDCQLHVGHVSTKWSPAMTNSSGVKTPLKIF